MVYKANSVSKGIGIGEVFLYKTFHPSVVESLIEPDTEEQAINWYEEIRIKAKAEIDLLKLKLSEDAEKAKIFTAHLDILDDPVMNGEIKDGIIRRHFNVDWAIFDTYEKYIKILSAAKDPVIRERAIDLKDVEMRLLRNCSGEREADIACFEKPVIIAAHELTPSDTVMMDPAKIVAILTENGGYSSHSAIIARNFGIPALSGFSDIEKILDQPGPVVVDAMGGLLITDPSKEQLESYSKKQSNYLAEIEKAKMFEAAAAITVDGIPIEVNLNIASADELELEGAQFTDGVGLFRTEFLFMGRSCLPSEEEQFEIYKKVLIRFGDRAVTLRTLDIGGDKKLECLNLPKEDNPFLGNRALRLCFEHMDIFKTQLRAALRASTYGNLRIMFPMVANIEDVRRAKTVLAEVRLDLDREKISYSKNIKIGIMIEIPSIALMADMVAQEVDFASIGSNDLIQYAIAVDRMNPAVSGYYQTYHPAVFRLISYVVHHFVIAGKQICVCGEMGGDCLSAMALIGMGMRQLSMSRSSVGKIKEMIGLLSTQQARLIAGKVVNCPTAAEAEELLKNELRELGL
ncbi:phosphoenolpyruvate--protein phosphotransferase [Clostridium sp. KNHs216]|uniref:phosphoenolpyruvate--protein phosphotransferase n=1 Tax=Clostridium sp. KNHs216 TaxID=1550235 RepID=UPI00115145F5|nr:phosphoenolpyruvate--protein phosphotransferase [Clostridium sp. KNHs216]TQI68935.1 phosphotransferase system enzyme I (PtsI) [Clostridium sp. KNHs216]